MTAVDLHLILERLGDHDIDAELHGGADVVVDDVFADHRQVRPGSLFCCVVGEHFDGHDFARDAVASGAVAVLAVHRVDVDVPLITVADVRPAVGPIAALVHGDPSTTMSCVGITGTNGKTTTAALLAAILEADGRTVEVIGTLTGTRTTPEAADLQRDLAARRDRGCTDVVMEVSSHALAQHRVDAMHYTTAVFTNLSRDHLDFHGSMEAYFRAKARLFEPDLSERGVVDVDDAYGRLLRDAAQIPIVSFGAADAEPVESDAPVAFTWAGAPVVMALAGRFNITNALAAATAARALGVDDATIRTGLAGAPVVPGRFEPIVEGQPFTVVVDYAHTPDGLAKVLETAREIAGDRRVLLVFGAGGDRDRTKRPLMGAVAESADVVVVTNDNPRSERPEAIAAEITSGMGHTDRVRIELDRRAAIAAALAEAEPGDVVLVAGKGHEATQTIGTDVQPFDDRAVVRELLAEAGTDR